MGRSLIPSLLALVALGALPAAAQARCLVPEGPVRAAVTWRGAPALARPGALALGDTPRTPCDGLPGPRPQALAVGPGGDLWVGFEQAGLHRLGPDGTFTAIAGLPAGGVTALATWDGAIYAGTGAAGLYRIDPARPEPVAVAHRTLGVQGITALRVGRDGLHVGVGPYGWWRLAPGGRAGGRITRLARGFVAGCFHEVKGRVRPAPPGPACALGPAPPESGLPSGHVSSLAAHAGALWVGLFDAGLARSADGLRFEPVPVAPRLVNALLPVGDTLWIGAATGLYFARDGQIRPAPVRLPSAHINALAAAPGGAVWIAHSAGITRLAPDGVRHLGVAEGLPARIVYALAVAADGAVWAGTAAGAARLGPAGVQTFTLAAGDLPHDWINALLPDGPDGVLAGTYDAGVVRLSPRGGAALPALSGAWVNPAGLSRDPTGALWIATLGTGLWRFDGTRATQIPGLPGPDVTARLTWRGAHYVGTRGGLARLDAPAADPLAAR